LRRPLAEDLITDLSRIAGLQVIPRNSTFTYKGQPVSVAQVGRELGVRHVVEGSVRKVDNRVRITAQLIDAATGMHVWADRYDRDLTDIFAVQDEVTHEIVGALSLRFVPRTSDGAWTARGTANLRPTTRCRGARTSVAEHARCRYPRKRPVPAHRYLEHLWTRT